MRYAPQVMRRRAVVAVAALIATAAMIGLPIPAGSRSPSIARDLQAAAFTSMTIPADAPASEAVGVLDPARRSSGFLADSTVFVEPGSAPAAPASRPATDQPPVVAGHDWKPPLSTVSGWATFYDGGTTAMRLPAGTVVRICGAGGCILRTVTDYGPVKQSRVVDMYRPDFFAICGCASWSGTTWVTIGIY
jgi:hypothetical protein